MNRTYQKTCSRFEITAASLGLFILARTAKTAQRTPELAHIASLEQRIADLEAENAAPRRRLAQVEHQLQNIRRRGQRPSQRRDPAREPHADRRRQDYLRRHLWWRGTVVPSRPGSTSASVAERVGGP